MKKIEDLESRFWEVDFLRGLAIIMMIIYHFLYFLRYFGDYRINLSSVFWRVFQIATASIFLFLVGVSLNLSYSRAKQEFKTEKLLSKYVKRGLRIFSLGLCMTALTWIFLKESYVRFGILHLIGISIILAYPFLKIHFWDLLSGIVFISLGVYLMNTAFDVPWLMWLGFVKSIYLHTVDYFPLLPWFGVTLIGLFIGKILFPQYKYKRKINLDNLSHLNFVKPFCFLGRHSLGIYFLHQPLLIGIIFIFNFKL